MVTRQSIVSWSWLRLAAAALILIAIATPLTPSISAALASPTPHGGQLATILTNFFSYFTILSNVSAAVALLVAGGWGVRRGSDAATEPAPIGRLLACVTTYMVTTGVVYNLLLRSAPVGISAPWVNEVLHVVAPLFLLADAFFAPARRRLRWRVLVLIAALPLVWIGYTLLRANHVVSPVTGDPWWYPYPFLDPHLVPGGYPGVAGYVAVVAAVIVGIGAGVVILSRWRGTG